MLLRTNVYAQTFCTPLFCFYAESPPIGSSIQIYIDQSAREQKWPKKMISSSTCGTCWILVLQWLVPMTTSQSRVLVDETTWDCNFDNGTMCNFYDAGITLGWTVVNETFFFPFLINWPLLFAQLSCNKLVSVVY